MGLVLAQLRFEHDTGIPEDVIVNTLHFEFAVENEVTANLVTAELEDMFDDTNLPGGGALSAFMSDKLTGDVEVRYYGLSVPPPRVPFAIDEFSISPPSGSFTDLPEEVAVVLSFKSAITSGVVPARRKNRIYIGPLNSQVIDDTKPFPEPSDEMQNRMAGAALSLKTASGASGGTWTWVTYSPTGGDVSPVLSGWVDAAFDTQRRRGPDATSRLLWA